MAPRGIQSETIHNHHDPTISGLKSHLTVSRHPLYLVSVSGVYPLGVDLRGNPVRPWLNEHRPTPELPRSGNWERPAFKGTELAMSLGS